MLLDANLLLYAVHERAEQHEQARAWMTEKLNGPVRVGFPWQSVNAFLRISTHPRAFQRPLDPATAWERVTDWLASPGYRSQARSTHRSSASLSVHTRYAATSFRTPHSLRSPWNTA